MKILSSCSLKIFLKLSYFVWSPAHDMWKQEIVATKFAPTT